MILPWSNNHEAQGSHMDEFCDRKRPLELANKVAELAWEYSHIGRATDGGPNPTMTPEQYARLSTCWDELLVALDAWKASR